VAGQGRSLGLVWIELKPKATMGHHSLTSRIRILRPPLDLNSVGAKIHSAPSSK